MLCNERACAYFPAWQLLGTERERRHINNHLKGLIVHGVWSGESVAVWAYEIPQIKQDAQIEQILERAEGSSAHLVYYTQVQRIDYRLNQRSGKQHAEKHHHKEHNVGCGAHRDVGGRPIARFGDSELQPVGSPASKEVAGTKTEHYAADGADLAHEALHPPNDDAKHHQQNYHYVNKTHIALLIKQFVVFVFSLGLSATKVQKIYEKRAKRQ